MSRPSLRFDPASKARLTIHDLPRFPHDTLFDRIARVVCQAGCLPRKELFEAWEVARRVRRRFRGGRVVDLCAGHGLLGQLLLILDESSPHAILVDRALPPSAERLHRVLASQWPVLAARVTWIEGPLSAAALGAGDLVVSIHACGTLTDEVIDAGVRAAARLGVVPCCHDLRTCDMGSLDGWLDGPMAVDVIRVTRLRALGWQVWTQHIPETVTPQNRLLLARPPAGANQR